MGKNEDGKKIKKNIRNMATPPFELANICLFLFASERARVCERTVSSIFLLNKLWRTMALRSPKQTHC